MRTPAMLVLCLAASAATGARAQAPEGTQAPLDFQTFHAALAPYGEWVVLASYGAVWRPAGVTPDWRPYFDGYWTWTDDGWFWVSEEPWAWATYHYGAWIYDATLGWAWVPGYDWAPAWVAWRDDAEYVGWAPLYPGAAAWWVEYPVPITYWCFVPVTRFVGVPVRTVFVPAPTVREIFHNTRPAPPPGPRTGPAPRFGGPPRPTVEAALGRPVAPVRVIAAPTPHAARPGRQEGAVTAYRPRGVAPPPGTAAPSRPSATAPPAPRAEPPAAAPRAEGVAPAPRTPPAPPPARAAPRGEDDRARR